MIQSFRHALVVVTILTLGSVSSGAAQTVVTPAAPQGWGVYTYGASAPAPYGAMTNSYPHLGNGSAEIRLADEGATMVQWWYELSSTAPLANLNQLSFDWYVSSASTTPNFTTPAFAMYIVGGAGGDGYLIWEGAYNGTIGGAPQDQWVSSDILGDNFWWNGPGTGNCANASAYNTLNWFMTQCLGSNAAVLGFSPFLGYGYVGTEFYGAFDNVAYGFEGGASDRFNFEVAGDGGGQEVVPEPATITLLATGLAGMAAARRRRQK